MGELISVKKWLLQYQAVQGQGTVKVECKGTDKVKVNDSVLQ